MGKDDNNDEFRGSTKQSLMDIREDINELKVKIDTLTLSVNNRDEHNDGKYVRNKDFALLFNQVERNSQDIEALNGWKSYVFGAVAVAALLLSFFKDFILSWFHR